MKCATGRSILTEDLEGFKGFLKSIPRTLELIEILEQLIIFKSSFSVIAQMNLQTGMQYHEALAFGVIQCVVPTSWSLTCRTPPSRLHMNLLQTAQMKLYVWFPSSHDSQLETQTAGKALGVAVTGSREIRYITCLRSVDGYLMWRPCAHSMEKRCLCALIGLWVSRCDELHCVPVAVCDRNRWTFERGSLSRGNEDIVRFKQWTQGTGARTRKVISENKRLGRW